MARIILHVGMHKTGTTSIQQTLRQSAAILRAGNLVYPALAANYSVLLQSAFAADPGRHQQHRRGGRTAPGEAARFGQAGLARLLAVFEQERGADVLLSGEGIAGLTQPETRAMFAVLGAAFPRIEVAFLVRPPASFLHSQAQQHIRAGRTLAQLLQRQGQVRYAARFRKYFALLPRDAIHAGLFARDALVGGCALRTLLTLCGHGDLGARIEVDRRNESLSIPAAERLLVANEILPATLPDGRPNPERAPGLVALLRTMPGPRFRAPLAMIEAGVRASREDIAWIDAALGIDLMAHDDAARDHDHLPETLPPAHRAALAEEVIEANRRLLADPPIPSRDAAPTAAPARP